MWLPLPTERLLVATRVWLQSPEELQGLQDLLISSSMGTLYAVNPGTEPLWVILDVLYVYDKVV